MKYLVRLLLLIPFVFNSFLTVMGQSVILDDSFGDEGQAIFDISNGYHETVNDIEILNDGSILIAGTMNDGNWGSVIGFVMKLNEDGSIQSEWGFNGGYTEIDIGLDTYINDIEIMNSNIVIGGTLYYTSSENPEPFVAKLGSSGTIYLYSFGFYGAFIGDYSPGIDIGNCMEIQDDNKIILAGYTQDDQNEDLLILRTTAGGNIDATFGNQGYKVVSSSDQGEEVLGMGLLSSGEIIAVGYSHKTEPTDTDYAMMIKLNSEGNLVDEFGENGILYPEWATSESKINDVLIIDDNLFITGFINDASHQVFLSKYHADGTIDESFGTEGVSFFELNEYSNAFSINMGLDNKVYLCGTTGEFEGPSDILIIRFTQDGLLDETFNTTGYVTTQIRPDEDIAHKIAMDDEGKILVGGYSSGTSTTFDNHAVVLRYLNDFNGVLADFETSSTEICVNNMVEFSDQSIGDIINWEWSFEGGTPLTSAEQNPTVVYESVGLFDVELTVFDGVNYNTLLMEDYILVDDCIGLEENTTAQILLYPNPCEDLLTLEFAANVNETTNVSIQDLSGRVIWESYNNESSGYINIDVSSFKKGVYLIQISDANSKMIHKRFVKN